MQSTNLSINEKCFGNHNLKKDKPTAEKKPTDNKNENPTENKNKIKILQKIKL